ncbi:hypothetical protein AtubIFM54640_005278 [Aspergillus tubingensis]|nr:hypothetical protein AtubIFM54640_005278 [Aspergillus tubingensis]
MIPEPIAAAVGGVVRMRKAKIWTKPENGVFHAHGDLIQEFIRYELSSNMADSTTSLSVDNAEQAHHVLSSTEGIVLHQIPLDAVSVGFLNEPVA